MRKPARAGEIRAGSHLGDEAPIGQSADPGGLGGLFRIRDRRL
jgi:hypothetical protein